jgi:anti-sigma B factor antagonist
VVTINPHIDELDASTAGALAGRLARLDAAADVVVDLRRVTFCDSSGLNVLVRARQRHVAAGGSLGLAHPSPMLRRLLSVSGLESVFDVA